MKRILLIVSLFTFIAPSISVFANEVIHSESILGTWQDEKNIMKVQIEKLGGEYFGKIVWLEKPNEADGSPKLDKYNPDKSLRHIPFIGLRILKNLVYKGEGIWGGGTIYDPEHGKTYSCKISLLDVNTANIRAFIGFSFIGKSMNFMRVL